MNVSTITLVCISCLVVYAALCLDVSRADNKEDTGVTSTISEEEHRTTKSTGTSSEDKNVSELETDPTELSSTAVGSSEGSTGKYDDQILTKSTLDPTELPSTVVGSSEGSTDKNGDQIVTKSTLDTNEDILITGTADPDVGEGSGEITAANTQQSVTPTIYDDDVTDAFTDSEDEGTNRTACWSNPCKNGGTCVEDEVIPLLFSCNCPEGYVGLRCGTKDACVQGHDGELCEHGACVYSDDGSLRSCHCFTGKYWDEDQKQCREPDPPCFPNPCLNGGTCSSSDDVVLCDCPSGFQGNNCSVQDRCGDCKRGKCVLDDKRTTKYCRCDDGLYWNEEERTCKVMVTACDSSPCLNGGSCFAVSDTEYNCTCHLGFSGKTCDVIEKCSTHEDCDHGTCTLSADKKRRTCQCDEKFYLEERSHKCEEITNVCQTNPCLNDGICTVLSATTYNCTCSAGYSGPKCGVRDLCKMDGGDAYCRNGECNNNFELGVYFCTCRDEREYFQYNKRMCVELDLCPLLECSSTEVCSMGKCECRDNYKWNNVTKKCEPDFCSSNPCPLDEMVCVEGTGSTDYKCSCQEGYAFNGTHCNEAICAFPGLNSCNQMCSPKENGYKCSCYDDFQMKEDNHTCLYTGNNTCSNKTCEKGFCVKENDVEVCLCPPGYGEIEGKCTDVCSSSQLPSGLCPLDECEVAKEGGFKCKCEGRLSLSEDKTTCTVRNVCHNQEIGWKTCNEKNAECVEDWELSSGFKCRCTRGHVQTEKGVCKDICSLDNNQRLCFLKGATCDVNENGKMTCRCLPYFKENEKDNKCTEPADFSYLITLPLDKSTYQVRGGRQRSMVASIDHWKISKDITVTIREMFEQFTRANVLSCNLKTGSDVILCKVEIQFTTEHEVDLKLLETEEICITNGTKKCLIPPLLVLVKDRISEDVVIQPTDPCDKDISNLVCGSETVCTSSLLHKSFNCSCKHGFSARRKSFPFGNTRSFIEICADIDECIERDPCPANSICTNTIGSYMCLCEPGYRRVADTDGTKCVEVCSPNPCTHGECSTRDDHDFDCKCEAGYRGTFCDLQDENFKSAKTNTVIVGVVLGGVLLIAFILFAVCTSRLRKKKTLENPGHMYYNSAEMTERRRVEGGAINNSFQRE